MSFALMPFVVDLDVLHASIGSKDDKLRRMIGGRFRQHLTHFDSRFDHLIEDGGPPIYEAIRAVIDGGVPSKTSTASCTTTPSKGSVSSMVASWPTRTSPR